MKFRALLEFDDPSALDSYLDARQRGLSWAGSRLSAFQRIKLGSVAWTDQLLDAFVICNAASLVGADCRIGEDAGLGAKENRWNPLLGSGEVVGCADFELGSLDDVRCRSRC